MLYTDSYQHPGRFAAAVMLQAKYQDDHRIVAVKGISESEMFGFEGTLHRFSGILGIYRTDTTALGNSANQPIGRWNLLCTKAQFNDLAMNLHKSLETQFKSHLASNGSVLADGAEEVTVVSRFKGKPMIDDASDGSTRDSGKDSYNSSWTSRLADFQVVIDIPKEVLHSFQPYPRVPPQSHPTKDSYAQVASRAESASTASPHVSPPPIPSPPDLTTVQTPAFVLHLQQEMANMEARIAAKIEAQQTELQATAPTPNVQQESAPPPHPLQTLKATSSMLSSHF
jgi:hypothetical protein